MNAATDPPSTHRDGAAGRAADVPVTGPHGHGPQPDEDPLDARVGPFHDTAGVARLLGVPETEVQTRREEHTLLAVPTSDGVWVYPAWQFNDREVIEALLPALRALREVDPWARAMWFVMANPDLDGTTPLEWLDGDGSAEVVVFSARRTAHEWVPDPMGEDLP